MGSQDPLIEWFKKLRIGITGIVAFATAIIGFIQLLRGDYHLGVTILLILALTALLFVCLFLAFARRPPNIPGGKGVHFLDDKYRPWAFVGIGFIFGLVCALLLVEQSRVCIITAFTGVTIPTPTVTPPDTPIPSPTSPVIRIETVAIQTSHGTYITAMNDQPGWNWELKAETNTVSDWEKFTLLHLDNGKVALKTFHGRFVSATGDDGCCNWILRAETLDRGVSEEFTLIVDGGKVAFETHHGRYVSATDAVQHWRVRAEATNINDWEKFTLVPQD